jgi:hypothetical protein
LLHYTLYVTTESRKRKKKEVRIMNAKIIAETAAEERREYMRKWRAANKDKVKKHTDDYWKRRAEMKLAKQEK